MGRQRVVVTSGLAPGGVRRVPGPDTAVDVSVDCEHIEGGEPAAGRWEFYLRHDRSHTRLIVRRGGDRMGHFVFDIAQFITAQRMMRGMKAGVERGRDLAEAATG